MSEGRAAFLARTDVSRETMERLDLYAALLERWTLRINLISPKTLPQLWTRHFLDSAQLLALAPAGGGLWADLGSGGGFPGAVVAIVAAEGRPDFRFALIESDQRKATFLRTVARETGVSFEVTAARVESLPSLGAAVLSARALAPLSALISFAKTHLSPAGRALFPKGASAQAELAEALETWSFDCETHPSETDEEAVILSIGAIERV